MQRYWSKGDFSRLTRDKNLSADWHTGGQPCTYRSHRQLLVFRRDREEKQPKTEAGWEHNSKIKQDGKYTSELGSPSPWKLYPWGWEKKRFLATMWLVNPMKSTNLKKIGPSILINPLEARMPGYTSRHWVHLFRHLLWYAWVTLGLIFLIR